MVADHALLQHIVKVRSNGGDIGYRQGEVKQAHDRSSMDATTVAPGHARRPLVQRVCEESRRCIHRLGMGLRLRH